METDKLENDIMEFYKILINNKREYLQLFSKLQIQIEGWFRGELMNYFKNCDYKMTTKNREVPINEGDRKKVDLKIGDSNEFESYWIELKHLLVGNQKGNKKSDGEQKGNNFSLNFHFLGRYFIASFTASAPSLKICHKPGGRGICPFLSIITYQASLFKSFYLLQCICYPE